MKKRIDFFGILILMLMIIGLIVRIYREKNNKNTAGIFTPKLFTMVFRPPMERHSEVIVDFDKKNLIFKNIDDEPIPLEKPTRLDGKRVEEYDEPTKVIPFIAKLDERQTSEIISAIKYLKTDDYTIVEGNYIDGISYNFSVIFSDKAVKVGNIALNKKPHQSRLIHIVLDLIKASNKFPENGKILDYYSHFN